MKLLAERKISASKELEEKINATRDEALLDKWLALASTVTSAEALFS